MAKPGLAVDADPAARMRQAVAQAKVARILAGSPPEQVRFLPADVPELLRLLDQYARERAQDRDGLRVRTVCDGLAEAGVPSAGEEVYRMLKVAIKPSWTGKHAYRSFPLDVATNLLRRLGRRDLLDRISQEAGNALREWARDPAKHWAMRGWIAVAGCVGSDEAVKALTLVLETKSVNIREDHTAAIKALGDSGNPKAVAPLVAYLRHHRQASGPMPREAAEQAVWWALASNGTIQAWNALMARAPRTTAKQAGERNVPVRQAEEWERFWGTVLRSLRCTPESICAVWEVGKRRKALHGKDARDLVQFGLKEAVVPGRWWGHRPHDATSIAALGAALRSSDRELRKFAAEELVRDPSLAAARELKANLPRLVTGLLGPRTSPREADGRRLLNDVRRRIASLPQPGDQAIWRVSIGKREKPVAYVTPTALFVYGQAGLFAIDKQTGRVLWHRTSAQQPPVRWLRAAPGGMLLAQCSNDLRAYEAETGKELWATGLRGLSLAGFVGDDVFLHRDGDLLSIRLKTGDLRLRISDSGGTVGLVGSRILAVRTEIILCADAVTGRGQWAALAEGQYFASGGNYDIHEAGGAAYLTRSGGYVEKIDLDQKAAAWRYMLKERPGPRILGFSGRSVFIEAGDPKRVIALDPDTGREQWRAAPASRGERLLLDATGPSVIVAVWTPYGSTRRPVMPMRLLVLSPRTGQELQRHEFVGGRPERVGPGRLIVAVANGVHLYDCRDGTLRFVDRPADVLTADPSWPQICMKDGSVVRPSGQGGPCVPLLAADPTFKLRPVWPRQTQAERAVEEKVLTNKLGFAILRFAITVSKEHSLDGGQAFSKDGKPLRLDELAKANPGEVFFVPTTTQLLPGHILILLTSDGVYKASLAAVRATKPFAGGPEPFGKGVPFLRQIASPRQELLCPGEKLWPEGKPDAKLRSALFWSSVIGRDGTVYTVRSGKVEARDLHGRLKEPMPIDLGAVRQPNWRMMGQSICLLPNGHLGITTGFDCNSNTFRYFFQEMTPEGKTVRTQEFPSRNLAGDASGYLYGWTNLEGRGEALVKYDPFGQLRACRICRSPGSGTKDFVVTPRGTVITSRSIVRFEKASAQAAQRALAVSDWDAVLAAMAALKPTNAKEEACVLYITGLSNLNKGVYHTAKADFNAAVEKDPQLLEARFARAAMCDLEGRIAEAVGQWSEVAEKAPAGSDLADFAIRRVAGLFRWKRLRPDVQVHAQVWEKARRRLERRSPALSRELSMASTSRPSRPARPARRERFRPASRPRAVKSFERLWRELAGEGKDAYKKLPQWPLPAVVVRGKPLARSTKPAPSTSRSR